MAVLSGSVSVGLVHSLDVYRALVEGFSKERTADFMQNIAVLQRFLDEKPFICGEISIADLVPWLHTRG